MIHYLTVKHDLDMVLMNFTIKTFAKLVMWYFSSRLALEVKAACIARCSAEECNSIVEETMAEEVAAMAQEILDDELRRVHKFIKRFEELIIFLYVYKAGLGGKL